MTTGMQARMRAPMRAQAPSRALGWALRSGLAAVALLAAVAVVAPRAGAAEPLGAEPNFFEQRRIEAQALETFRRIIMLWQEEVYFELYDHGMAASKARITREEFAQRMVELSWVPEGELSPRHLKAGYRFRTAVYVSARIPYRHKFNPDNRFARDQTLLLLQEDGQWKVDLIALVRAPFSGV